MKIINPQDQHLINARDALLQQAMRPDPLPFSVAEEYPIVLHPKEPQYSYCALVEDEVVGHANLWPRILSADQKQIKIGLIGNVATHTAWRGQGIMTQLFEHLTKEAKAQKFEALILWSDLHQFYQKLGYTSLSEEFRFYFDAKTLKQECQKLATQFLPMTKTRITDELLQSVKQLRYKTNLTLERSVEEFQRLLRIPATTLFCAFNQGDLLGFCIVGKGYDMAGVVHEWGALTPEITLTGLRDILAVLEIPEMILLCPKALDQKWKEAFGRVAKRVETHPMALVLNLSGRKELDETLNQSFIWGLDSI